MLSEQIKKCRKESGYTQEELAKILRNKYGLGTDRAMISKWETGFQEPQIHTVTCLADLFGVSIDFLNNDVNKKLQLPDISSKNIEFAVIGEVAAGFNKIAIEDWTGDKIKIPIEYLKGKNKEDFFVLRVKGDSMYPLYIDGDKLLVQKQNAIDYSGQVAVVIYDSELGTIKKIEQKKDSVQLVPVNPQYQPQVISGADIENIHILGIPKLLVRDLEK